MVTLLFLDIMQEENHKLLRKKINSLPKLIQFHKDIHTADGQQK